MGKVIAFIFFSHRLWVALLRFGHCEKYVKGARLSSRLTRHIA